jgi:general stress protein 26
MDVTDFSEIEKEFTERIARIAWCTMTTTDRKNRLRARIIHPIWEGPAGWIATGRHSHKAKHLAHSPWVSLSYWDPQHQRRSAAGICKIPPRLRSATTPSCSGRAASMTRSTGC